MTILIQQARGIVEGESNWIANLANLSALLFSEIPQLNWCGFYLLDKFKHELVLGPFQGKVACIRIPFGKGVCGMAWKEKRSFNVPDVHAIQNHIACDGASNSELVIPLIDKEEFWGVLDLDSPSFNRFDSKLQAELEELCRELISSLNPKL
jgi:L-methionine (R)-S-oxide reductase